MSAYFGVAFFCGTRNAAGCDGADCRPDIPLDTVRLLLRVGTNCLNGFLLKSVGRFNVDAIFPACRLLPGRFIGIAAETDVVTISVDNANDKSFFIGG